MAPNDLSLISPLRSSHALLQNAPSTSASVSSASIHLNPPSADNAKSELYIKQPNIRFHGTIDRVQLSRDGDIISDFKTGAPKPEHASQLRLYMLLWWLQTGRLTRECQVIYADLKEDNLVLAGLSIEELQQQKQELLDRIKHAEALYQESPPPARPAQELCKWCDVRANCPEFWKAPATMPLRWTDEALKEAWSGDTGQWRDAELSLAHCTGTPDRLIFALPDLAPDAVLVMDVPARFQNLNWAKAAHLRVLNVLLKREGKQLRSHIAPTSEVFWVEATT